MSELILTLKDYIPIKLLYKKAIEDKEVIFKYKGCDILVDYAKYLLEYMEMQLNRRKQ